MPVIGNASAIYEPAGTAAAAVAAQHTTDNGTYAPLPTLAQAATLYVTAAGSDSNSGLTWAQAKATISACQTAAPSGPLTILLGTGTLATQSFQVDRDGLTVRGQGKTQTTIRWDSVGAAISNSTPATTRKNVVLAGFHLYLQNQPTNGIGIQVDNFYRPKIDDVWIDQLAVSGIGLKFVGDNTKSTYYATCIDVDVTSGGSCVSIGDNCNGHEFFGGVLDGTGVAINIQPVTYNAGESKWFGTKISTSNTRTANVGGGGALAVNHEFYGLRVETGVSAGWVFSSGQGQHCLISGGTFSGCTVNPGAAADGNNILVPSAGTFWFAQNANLIVGNGGANTITVTPSDIIQNGSNSAINLGLSAKGAGAVTVNGRANSLGTAGFTVYDGAASPAVAFAVSAGGVLSGKKLQVAITGSRSGNAALASLLSTLALAGIIVDSTTA